MIYPQKINANKSDFIIKSSILASILLAIILLIINKLTTPEIPWAALTNSGIVYVWITVLYAINKNINIAGHVLIQTIAISLLTVYIDYRLGFNGWSLSIAIPIIIIIANLTMLILTIISHKKYIRYAIYQLIIVLCSMVPVILITEKLVEEPILGMVATFISILNLILTLVLCTRDVKEAIIRKFHL